MNEKHDLPNKESFEQFQTDVMNNLESSQSWKPSYKNEDYKIYSIQDETSNFNKLFAIINFKVTPSELYDYFQCKEYLMEKDQYMEKNIDVEKYENSTLVYCNLFINLDATKSQSMFVTKRDFLFISSSYQYSNEDYAIISKRYSPFLTQIKCD
jgi:hypothetical protein